MFMTRGMKASLFKLRVYFRLMPAWKRRAWQVWKRTGSGTKTIRSIRCDTPLTFVQAWKVYLSFCDMESAS